MVVLGVALTVAVAAGGAWRYGSHAVRLSVDRCAAGLAQEVESVVGTTTNGLGAQLVWYALRGATSSPLLVAGACGALAAARAAWGMVLFCAVASLVLRRGALTGAQAAPLSGLMLTLGVGAGAAGYHALRGVGGDGAAWLVAWETLCLSHAFVAYAAAPIIKAVEAAAPERRGVVQAALVVLLGVGLPVAAGAAPWLRAALDVETLRA